MQTKNLNERSSTVNKLTKESKTSKAYKKKLYRKRTMEEVGRRINFMKDTADKYSDRSDDNNVADDTLKLVGDSADTVKEEVRSYSSKLVFRIYLSNARRTVLSPK